MDTNLEYQLKTAATEIVRALRPFVNIHGVLFIPGVHYPLRLTGWNKDTVGLAVLEAMVKHYQEAGWDKARIHRRALYLEGTGDQLRHYPNVLSWIRARQPSSVNEQMT